MSHGTDWTYIDAAKLDEIVVPNSTARIYRTLGHYLATEPFAESLIRAIGQIILGSAKVDPVYAPDFRASFRGLSGATLAAITSPVPTFVLPTSPLPIVPKLFTSGALKGNEVIFVHPERSTSYLIEPASHVEVILGSPATRLIIAAGVGRVGKIVPKLTYCIIQ